MAQLVTLAAYANVCHAVSLLDVPDDERDEFLALKSMMQQ